MHQSFHRDRFTWLAYLSLAFYAYFSAYSVVLLLLVGVFLIGQIAGRISMVQLQTIK